MYSPMSSSGFLMSGSCSSCCRMGALPFAAAVGRPRLGAMESESAEHREGVRARLPTTSQRASLGWDGVGAPIHEYLSYS